MTDCPLSQGCNSYGISASDDVATTNFTGQTIESNLEDNHIGHNKSSKWHLLLQMYVYMFDTIN